MCPTFDPVGVQVPLRGVCLKIVPRFCRTVHTHQLLGSRRGADRLARLLWCVCVRACVRACGRLYRLEPAHAHVQAQARLVLQYLVGRLKQGHIRQSVVTFEAYWQKQGLPINLADWIFGYDYWILEDSKNQTIFNIIKLEYDTVGRWIDRTIVSLSDGPMFIW